MGPLFECAVNPRLLPWLNWSEKTNIYAPGGIADSISIFDLLKQNDINHRVYSYHKLADAQIFRQAKEDIASSQATFFFLYLSEFDHLLHRELSDQKAVSERLIWYEECLREIFNLAQKKDERLTFTVISDHGMALVRGRYDLVGKIQSLGFKMPDEYLAVYDSTMARYWFRDERARQVIVGELKRIECGRVLEDAQLNRLGILFPDRRYGEVIFLFDPGWLIAQSDFNGADWNPTGMHGYHPSDPHSDAVFLSNRKPQRRMNEITDIYSCFEEAIFAK
jgi:hypothetical protein